MATYESQRIRERKPKKSPFSELLQMIQMFSTVSQNQVLKDKAIADALEKDNETRTNIATKYSDYVENVITPSDVTAANIYSSSLEGLIKNHPEAFYKKKEGDAKLNEKTSEMNLYTNAIDGGYNKYDKIKDLEDEDYLGWSIDYIMQEMSYTDNFLSSMRKDPLKEDSAGLDYIGHYKKGGMTDISIIGAMDNYKKTLDAALISFEDNDIIDLHELFFIKTGQGDKLEQKRKDVRRDTGSILTNLNKQRNYLSNLRNSTMSTFTFQNMKDDTILNNIRLSDADYDVMWSSEALYQQDKDVEPVSREEFELSLDAKIAQGDFTVSDYLGYLEDMENDLNDIIEQEEDFYFKWVGRRYQQEGAKERKIRKELEKLKKK